MFFQAAVLSRDAAVYCFCVVHSESEHDVLTTLSHAELLPFALGTENNGKPEQKAAWRVIRGNELIDRF